MHGRLPSLNQSIFDLAIKLSVLSTRPRLLSNDVPGIQMFRKRWTAPSVGHPYSALTWYCLTNATLAKQYQVTVSMVTFPSPCRWQIFFSANSTWYLTQWFTWRLPPPPPPASKKDRCAMDLSSLQMNRYSAMFGHSWISHEAPKRSPRTRLLVDAFVFRLFHDLEKATEVRAIIY